MADVINFAKAKEKFAKANNDAVLECMKDKEDDLCAVPMEETWFPDRGKFDRKLGRMVPSKPLKTVE